MAMSVAAISRALIATHWCYSAIREVLLVANAVQFSLGATIRTDFKHAGFCSMPDSAAWKLN
jgi:hypothetical protein